MDMILRRIMLSLDPPPCRAAQSSNTQSHEPIKFTCLSSLALAGTVQRCPARYAPSSASRVLAPIGAVRFNTIVVLSQPPGRLRCGIRVGFSPWEWLRSLLLLRSCACWAVSSKIALEQ